MPHRQLVSRYTHCSHVAVVPHLGQSVGREFVNEGQVLLDVRTHRILIRTLIGVAVERLRVCGCERSDSFGIDPDAAVLDP